MPLKNNVGNQRRAKISLRFRNHKNNNTIWRINAYGRNQANGFLIINTTVFCNYVICVANNENTGAIQHVATFHKELKRQNNCFLSCSIQDFVFHSIYFEMQASTRALGQGMF